MDQMRYVEHVAVGSGALACSIHYLIWRGGGNCQEKSGTTQANNSFLRHTFAVLHVGTWISERGLALDEVSLLGASPRFVSEENDAKSRRRRRGLGEQ